jgi:nicotinamide N-methyltransferase
MKSSGRFRTLSRKIIREHKRIRLDKVFQKFLLSFCSCFFIFGHTITISTIFATFSQPFKMSNADSENDELLNIFNDPQGYYPPSPKPTTEKYALLSGYELSLQLVGHNPLWGHHLWNAGRIISKYLESNMYLIESKTVLELGAGAGLPSLVCAILGAQTVVVTDYPDPDLIENLRYNIGHCQAANGAEYQVDIKDRITAEGYLWGADPSPLLAHIKPKTSTDGNPIGPTEGFDVLILADLLFNHSEHAKLVSTIKRTLARSPLSKAFVFFTPYRPWLLNKDLAFFDLVSEAGFNVEKVLEEKMDKVMFENDRGDEEIRRKVFGYLVEWKEQNTLGSAVSS